MKFLYRPVKPWKPSQRFGEDRVCFRTLSNGAKQYKGKHTHEKCEDVYGSEWQSVYRRMKGHNGLDIRTYRHQPCYAALDGKVLEISTDENEGLGVVLWHKHKDRFWKTRYWHFIAINPTLERGDTVKTGDLIGYCDSTGRSTGDHLHFDLKELDNNGKIKDYDNGFFGAVDPEDYLKDDFALDVRKLEKMIELLTQQLENLARRIRHLRK